MHADARYSWRISLWRAAESAQRGARLQPDVHATVVRNSECVATSKAKPGDAVCESRRSGRANELNQRKNPPSPTVRWSTHTARKVASTTTVEIAAIVGSLLNSM